jgi:hypothetical protein
MDKPTENQVVTDERFFSKPIKFPSGKITNEQRAKFAKDLESVIDETKTKFKDVVIKAEAPDNDVIALYARNVTREECESMADSEIIQRATTIGFRTFSCQDKITNHLISFPITSRQGEIRIGP